MLWPDLETLALLRGASTIPEHGANAGVAVARPGPSFPKLDAPISWSAAWQTL